MRPEDVADELLEKAVRAVLEERSRGNTFGIKRDIRHALAAVLREIQAQAVAPLLAVHAEYFNTDVDAYEAAEDFATEDTWRFDRDFREAARLTAPSGEATT